MKSFSILKKDIVLLAVCVVGVAAVAWWAAQAGPVHDNQSVQASTPASRGASLSSGSYNPALPSGSAAAAVGQAQPSVNNTSPAVVSPPPAGNLIAPPTGSPALPVKCAMESGPGIHPYIVGCPVGCDSPVNPGPCSCGYNGGNQLMCEAL